MIGFYRKGIEFFLDETQELPEENIVIADDMINIKLINIIPVPILDTIFTTVDMTEHNKEYYPKKSHNKQNNKRKKK